MTHRTALALSVALTLVLGAGVLIGRDRLFGVEAMTGPSTTIPMSEASSSFDGASATEIGPRIVELPFPVSLESEPVQERGYEDESPDERDSDHDDRDDDEDEDEDEDDEDDDD
jgi:hypothetical protein